jgi:hypothetical protein
VRLRLARALALFRLDLRSEAVREWNWTLRGMNDRELLAAAELARRYELWDRGNLNLVPKKPGMIQHEYLR